MKLFDEFGNDVTDQYVALSEHNKLKEDNCCLKEEVTKLSSKKKKRSE